MSTNESDGSDVVKDAVPISYRQAEGSVPKKFTSPPPGEDSIKTSFDKLPNSSSVGPSSPSSDELSNRHTSYTSGNSPPATPVGANPVEETSSEATLEDAVQRSRGRNSPPATPVEETPSDATLEDGVQRSRDRRRREDKNDDTESSKKIRTNRKKHAENSKREEILPVESTTLTPREHAKAILSVYDCIRRRLNQIDEAENGTRNSHLMASAIMTDNRLKIKVDNPVGAIPGVEVGDIYFFRFEMILIGLHVQVMSGIDTITNKADMERLAISVVSSGKYDEMDDDDPNVLYYSGQGGNNGKADQKLDRGNLAMERSLHRSNPIRVIRGIQMKPIDGSTGKIYVYDGLYEIDESWISRSEEGFKLFKFKMIRQPDQPEVYGLWKKLDQWRRIPASRGDVVTVEDISSGMERYPVCVVNEIDSDKEPDPFSYLSRNLYSKSRPYELLPGCDCTGRGVRPGGGMCNYSNPNCNCLRLNDGNLPYSSNGILTLRKPLIYECTSLCECSLKCPNRLTQTPSKLHFEVFKTENKGWGLRSWDPIRCGTFVCEYNGSIIDLSDEHKGDRYLLDTTSGEMPDFTWNIGVELFGEQTVDAWDERMSRDSFVISAWKFGNVSRFINHSCTPNLFWQLVQKEHGENGYPHVMFFAMEHIPPMTELTFDYGTMGGTKEKCLCGAENCRGDFG